MNPNSRTPREPADTATHIEGLNRRQLLAGGAATALSLLPSKGFGSVQPQPPANLRTAKPVLSQGDLRFAGFYRFPREAGDLWYTYPNLALRKTAGEVRLFSIGNTPPDSQYPTNGNNPIFEVAVPSALPSKDMTAAPVMPFRRMWGHIMAGRMITSDTASNAIPGGLFWDEGRHGLWWTYGSSYVPVQHHPTLGFTQLDDTSGAFHSHGPWRTEWHCQRTRGQLIQIPDAFAAAHTANKTVAVMAGQASGNAGSPFGCNLSALGLPDPLNTAPDSTANSNWSVSNHGIILHDLQHRQSRDTRYKVCGWSQPPQPKSYDCRIASYISPGVPLWGGPEPAAGENDTINGGIWIDLPDKHGVLFFGHLITTPEGYIAPGDPDGLVHMWYGDPDHASNTGSISAGFANGKCCHGQDDAFWGATGPAAHYRVPMAWIYDPSDFVATATKAEALWSRTPKSTFQWRQPEMPARMKSGMFGGAAFDPQNRRLYVVLRSIDMTYGLYSRPAIMVFDVA